MSLGVYGFGCEDALIHLLNYVWPNIFETSPHLVQAFMDAVEGMRVSLGPVKILQYVLQVRTSIFLDNFIRGTLDQHFNMVIVSISGTVPPSSESAGRLLEDL